MTEWDRLRRQAQRMKENYPAGTRIMLLHMGADPNPVAPKCLLFISYIYLAKAQK